MHNEFYQQILRGGPPYIIAELGANHNGDMKLARNLIAAAKEAGADCVKFQSWTKESVFSRKIYDDNYFLKDDYRNRTDFTMEQLVEKFSISENELLEMNLFARESSIDCTSTPFSNREVDYLVDTIRPPFIKIASMDINNYPFLDYIARKNLPIVISTGLSELSEIDKAIRTIEKRGNKMIVILHCVSIYPPKDEQINLENMETLKRIYPYPVGFSDHTLGFSIPLAAVAKQACIIEKHFTLDKNMEGWDHKISATPEELKIICSESKRITKALGTARILCEEDVDRLNAFRRSIVTTRVIKAGEIIQSADLDYKRPGSGIPPEAAEYIVGRTAKNEIACDQPISLEDLV